MCATWNLKKNKTKKNNTSACHIQRIFILQGNLQVFFLTEDIPKVSHMVESKRLLTLKKNWNKEDNN